MGTCLSARLPSPVNAVESGTKVGLRKVLRTAEAVQRRRCDGFVAKGDNADQRADGQAKSVYGAQ